MGVKGLWKLLDGTGRPVNLESLEGKILAVDISVWLNMAIKGMRDYHGHSSATAHLTTLFNRICKLLYYGVKPVFVFDGQAPALKKKTLRERREQKNFNVRESKKASEKILQNYLKKQILQEAVGKRPEEDKPSTSKNADEGTTNLMPSKGKSEEKDIYDLPPLASQMNDSDQDDLEEELKMRSELQSEYLDDAGNVDIAGIMSMDIESKDFATLPSEVQYELLKDLHEIRKRRRTRLEAMPEESNSFSDYQIAGLLAKRKITKKMESVENKMSEENLAASSALSGLGDDTMKDHMIDARQLVSDSTSHYIWMRKMEGKKDVEAACTEEATDGKLPIIVEEENSVNEEEEKPQKPIEISSSDSDEDASPAPSKTNKNNAAQTTETKSEGTPIIVDLTKPENGVTASDLSRDHSIHVKNKNTIEDLSIVTNGSTGTKFQLSDTEKRVVSSKIKVAVENGSNVAESKPGQLPQEETVALNTKTTFDSTNENTAEDSSPIKSIIKVHETESSETGKKTASHAIDGQDLDSDAMVEYKLDETTELNISNNTMSEDQPRKPDFEFSNAKQVGEPVEVGDGSSDEDFIDVPEQTYDNVAVEERQEEGLEDTNTTEEKSEDDGVVTNPWEGLDAENIENFTSQLDEQSKDLYKLMKAKERAAKDLSQSAQMECQELLKLFGLPYIISPQEAEAQCATLELLGLTQGTITEDSDIWLFGGRYVIKDMFGSKSDPVAFNLPDIEMQLGLSRDRFICIALCTGSDYTTGIHGVGPVTAMEILKEFEGDGIEGLLKLRQWWDEVCSSTKQVLPTETKIKSQLRRVNLRRDFPSAAVYNAYTQPVVDDTNKKFEWGFPDLDELRMFATGTMGWTRQKVDEVLVPVMKKLGQQRSTQTRMTQFLPQLPRAVNKKKSKRVMRAAAILTGKVDPSENVPKKRQRRQTNKKGKKVEVKKEEVKLNLSESSSDED